jgi:hypothetical protein
VDAVKVKAVVVFSGSGPLLLLTSYERIDDPAFIGKLRAKGILKFIAYEVPVERCEHLYGYSYRDIVSDLQKEDDLRVLDFDGHRIFLNFSLRQMGEPVIHEEETASIS